MSYHSELDAQMLPDAAQDAYDRFEIEPLPERIARTFRVLDRGLITHDEALENIREEIAEPARTAQWSAARGWFNATPEEHAIAQESVIATITRTQPTPEPEPAECTRVWWSFTFDDLMTADDYASDDYTDEPKPAAIDDLDRRLAIAYPYLVAKVQERYPNATDLWQECVGWSDGGSANFTPRAESADGRSDPEFFDWLTEQTDALPQLFAVE